MAKVKRFTKSSMGEPPDPAAVALGDRVRRAREDIGVTQTEVAKKMGVTRSFLSQVEAGKSGILMPKLRQLANILRVPFDSLASGAGVISSGSDGMTEAILVDIKKLDSETRQIAEVVMKGKDAEVWQLTSDVVAAKGWHSGDYLVVDKAAKAESGDIVLATSHGVPLFRIFLPPHLYRAVLGAQPAPIDVDNVNVIIKGVVIRRI